VLVGEKGLRNMGGARRSRISVLAVVGIVAFAACKPTPTPAAPPVPPPPAAFTAIGMPANAVPTTHEWYWAPAPGGHAVTLGVYRPTTLRSASLPGRASTASTPPVTVLVLNGADGFRQIYQDLAQRFAATGFIAIVGCWYDHPAAGRTADTIACVDGPTWKGMNAAAVLDVDALVDAVHHVPGVDLTRVVLVGHSYGAGVSLLRAASGAPEPVVASSGLLARSPFVGTPLSTDQFPLDVAASITVPVLLANGDADDITPIGQAQALAAAMTSDGNPPTQDVYGAPAGHAFPWQPDILADDPGVPIASRYVRDATAWITARFAPPAPGAP
jgi:dienelactone hydrolase